MRKILVTGGAGFIGSHTIVELIASGYEPIIVDNFSNSEAGAVAGIEKIIGRSVSLYKVDCCDKESFFHVFEKEKPEAIIHFAAFKAVGESVNQPLKYYHNNVGGMLNVLEAMKAFDVRHLVFSSSCTVYGQPKENPVTEDSATQEATSPYGYTKQVCERMIKEFMAVNREFNAAMLRYFNPTGAHPSGIIGELPYGVPNNLVPFITQTAAGIREKLTIHGNDYDTEDGTCLRDYIHVVDLAKAHVQSLAWLEKNEGACRAFNLGTGNGDSVHKMVKVFEKVSGTSLNYAFGPRRSGDVEQIWADPSRAHKELLWKTELTIEDALRDSWNWQLKLAERK